MRHCPQGSNQRSVSRRTARNILTRDKLLVHFEYEHSESSDRHRNRDKDYAVRLIMTKARDIGPNGSRSWREQLFKRERVAELGLKRFEDCFDTPHWKQFRRTVFEDQRKRLGHNKCELCGERDVTLIVHHLTYERLGAELLSDVRIVCKPCHGDIIHGRGSGVAPQAADFCPWRQVDASKRVRRR